MRLAFVFLMLGACTLLKIDNDYKDGRYPELKQEAKVDEPRE